MLLAAGFGDRMVPITFLRAKPALPFLNRPLLLRQLDHLAAAGIDEVVVNMHHRPASLLALLSRAEGGGEAGSQPPRTTTPADGNPVAKQPAVDEKVSQVDATSGEPRGPFRIGGLQVHVCVEPEILGTSGGLLGAAAHLAGDEPFLCLNSDFVCDIDLRAAIEVHRQSGRDATMVLRPAGAGDRFTPVWHNGHRVLAFGDAPAGVHADSSTSSGPAGARTLPPDPPPASAHLAAAVFTGIHVLEPTILEQLPPGRSEFLPALYAPMIAAGTGPGVCLSDAAWYEVGTPERYLDAQIELLPAGKIGAHRPWLTAAQDPTRDAGSSLTGSDCRIHPEAYLGTGTILGDNVHVGAAAHIERSVILDGAIVGTGARLCEVIVGPDTRIPPQANLTRTVLDRGVEPGDTPSRKRTVRRWEGLWRADF